MRKGLLCFVLLIFALYVFMAGIFKEFLPVNTYVQPTYYGQNILTDNEALASDIIIPSKNAFPNNEDKGSTVFIKKVLTDNDKDYNVKNADIASDYKEGDIDAVNVTTLNLSNANIKIVDRTFNDSFAVNVGENTYEFSNLDYSLIPSLDEPYNETVGFHWDWPAHIFKKMYYAVDMGKFIDACVDTVVNKILDSEKQDKMPENAYVEYDKDTGEFVIVPEQIGNKINETNLKKTVYDVVIAGVYKMAPKWNGNLADISGFYMAPDILGDDSRLVQMKNALNTYLNTVITVSENGKTYTSSKEDILPYIQFSNDTLEYSFENEAFAKHIADNIKKMFNTVGNTRTLTTHAGDEVSIRGGNWGWSVDVNAMKQNIIEALASGNGDVKIAWAQKAYAGSNGKDYDANNYIEIDMRHQKLYMYKNGECIVDTDIVTGNVQAGHNTPSGSYILNYKTKNTYLRGPTWNSFVNYWMPFNGGIGLHDATWRNSFGGTIYKTDGSHGCVNLPKNAAKTIYENIGKDFAIFCIW